MVAVLLHMTFTSLHEPMQTVLYQSCVCTMLISAVYNAELMETDGRCRMLHCSVSKLCVYYGRVCTMLISAVYNAELMYRLQWLF